MKHLIFVSIVLSLSLFYSCSDDNSLNEAMKEAMPESLTHHHSKTCSHAQHMEGLMSDPAYKAAYEKRMKKHKAFVAELVETRSSCSSPVTIPVAVHYQGANTSATLSCLTTMAQQQIAALNADFQGTNSDITNWTGNASSSFPGISFGEACLEFVLADQNHPSGYGLVNGDLAVTRNATSGDSDSNWSGYLNIFVKNAGGALGYSPLGGAGNGDGVVIDLGAFGLSTSCGNVGASAPYNLGRTLTHEIGHYLNLDHIWGNGCTQDDGISDTPNSQSDYSGCPSIGVSSCGSTDLHMNYMDYTNDACMYMFTAGQATENENYVASSLGIITGNASSVISGNSGGSGGGSGGSGNPTCDKPGPSSVEILSNTSVKVNWDDVPQAIKYQIHYRVAGTSTWTIKTVTVSEKTLTGLTVASDYEYRLRTRCPLGWTGVTTIETFTTPGGGSGGGSTCDKPGFSATEYLTASRTRVTWEAMPQAIRYHIRYRAQGTSAWTTKGTTQAAKTLTGLQNGTTYEYRIRTRCASGWTGFTAIETFTQSNGGGGGGSTNNTIHFNLTLDDYGSETSWELVDSGNNILQSGGPFADGTNGTVVSETFSLPDGCYTIYVDDAYGDGICCQYGNGSFEILDINNSQVGYSDGLFGNYDYIDFCVTNNVATFDGGERDEKEVNLAPKAALSGY